MPLLLTLAVLAIDPSAARTDVSGGVAGEVRGGWAPVQLNEQSQGAFLLVLSPNIDLRRSHRRHGTLSIGYSPRMFLRIPNRLSLNRPLVFHQASIGYDRPLSRRWEFGTQANADVGELDYTSASFAFDPNQTTLPQASVLSFVIVNGGFGFMGQVTNDTRLGISTSAGTRRSLGDVPSDGAAPFPNLVYASFSIGPRVQLTARDGISLTAVGQVNDFDPGALFGSGDFRFAWIRTLRRNLELVLEGGVFVTQAIARQNQAVGDDGATFPVGNVAVNGRLRARANYRLDGGLGTGFSGFFDAVLGRLLYRARFDGRLQASFPPRWTVGLDASFVTAPTAEPLPVAPMGLPIPETLAQVQTPIRYFFDENKNIEFGAIFGVRAPHLASPTLGDNTRYEAWAYFAFRIGGGTARGGREVATRRTAI